MPQAESAFVQVFRECARVLAAEVRVPPGLSPPSGVGVLPLNTAPMEMCVLLGPQRPRFF